MTIHISISNNKQYSRSSTSFNAEPVLFFGCLDLVGRGIMFLTLKFNVLSVNQSVNPVLVSETTLKPLQRIS